MRHHLAVSISCAAALAAGATAQVRLTELATVNLDSTSNAANPEFVGTNPSAVAWNGTRLFVAGLNNSAGSSAQTMNCSIVEVLNPLSGTASYGAAFGTVSTPFGGRGYIGLDIEGARLAAAYDPGATSPQGIAGYDFAGNQLWVKATRGGSGVGFDPGTPTGTAQGRGVGWTTFGSGRRALQDAGSGADIWTTSDGMVILTGEGTYWRDMDFDAANGDVWLREGNNVIQGVRSGDNTLSALNVVFDQVPDADFINLQNVAFCRTPTGPFVIYNSRVTSSVNQGLFQTVLAMRPDGSALPLDFGAFSPQTGTGAYDFSYDAATNTLALLDVANRNVHLFQVDFPPYFAYGSGCRGSNGMTPELSASGPGTVGSTMTYRIANGPANSQAFVLIGLGEGSLPLYAGCDVLVTPILPFTLGPLGLDGTGAGTTTLPVIAAASGGTLTTQAAMIDVGIGGALPLILSNGLRHDIP